jgi:hypothetical protein
MFSEIAIQAAIIGAIVGGLCSLGITSRQLRIAHHDALELIKRQEFIKAAAIFRNAFMDVLIFSGEKVTGVGGEKRIAEILTESIGGHEKAMLLFRAYLPDGEYLAFDNAWNEYSRHDQWRDLGMNAIFAEYGQTFDPGKEKEKRHLASLRIKKLLDLAPVN